MYRANQELGIAFGSRSTGQPQKFSYPDNRCPRGYDQTGSGADKPPWGYSAPWGNFVMCKPTPVRATPIAPPPPAPVINVRTEVSPTLQTEISPQISPVFSQMQDSPGSTQAATTAQVKPGGMTSDRGGGGDTALLEFMRMQAEQDRERRIAESAEREKDRQQATRDAHLKERQFIAQQADAQQREAARQEQLRLQQESEQARALRQEQIDADWRAQNEAQQAAYEAALEQRPQGTPSTLVSTAVMPGRQMITADEPIVIDQGLPQETGPNWLLIGGGVLLAGGVYYLSTKKGKKK